MTIIEAIEIVENFNKWRLGESDHIAKPSQITEAINVVVASAKYDPRKAWKELQDANKIDLNKNRFQ